MAASASSIHFSIPQSVSFQGSPSSGSASLSTLCTPFSVKPLTKLGISFCSIVNVVRRDSRFIRNVAFSSGVEEEVDDGEEDGLDFSGSGETNFSPDLKLFVGNLPFTVDSAALAELFGKVGTVEMVEVIYDKFTGRSRGFGFVTMSTVEDVEAAAEQLNGYEFEGRALRVNSGPPPSKRERSPLRGGVRGRERERSSFDDSNKLYVGNLAWAVDNLALETLFSEQGKVKEARVVYDKESGRSRGFGFVTYSSPEEVTNAIELLDGIDLNGRSIRVSPAEARPMRQY